MTRGCAIPPHARGAPTSSPSCWTPTPPPPGAPIIASSGGPTAPADFRPGWVATTSRCSTTTPAPPWPVWLAAEAKSLGLVDRVETLDSAVELLTAPLRGDAARARHALGETFRGGSWAVAGT